MSTEQLTKTTICDSEKFLIPQDTAALGAPWQEYWSKKDQPVYHHVVKLYTCHFHWGYCHTNSHMVIAHKYFLQNTIQLTINHQYCT